MKRYVPSVVPGVLMLVTALISITAPGFSWDEVATADIARRTPAEIWRLMRHIDAVLGPYYLFMHTWTGLAGTSETAMRLPQVLAMALAAALTGELGRRLFTPLTGLTAGLILVIIPNSYRYAAEARPYAFSVLFSALSLLLLHTALDRPRWWRWALYGLSVLLLGLTHIVGLSVLAAHALIVLLRARRLLLTWTAVAVAVVSLLAPLALLGAGQQSGQVAWIKPLTTAVLRRSPGELIGSTAAAWILIGLILLVAARPHLIELAALCAAPMLALAGYSLLAGPLWVPRYLLVVLPPIALLAAVAIVRGAGSARGFRRGGDDQPLMSRRQDPARTTSTGHCPTEISACSGRPRRHDPHPEVDRLSAGSSPAPIVESHVSAARPDGPAAHPRAATGRLSHAGGVGHQLDRLMAHPRAAAARLSHAGGVGHQLDRLMTHPRAAAGRLSQAARPRLRVWFQVALVLVVLIGAAWPEQREQRGNLAKNGSDYRTLTRLIQARDLPGDAILYQDGNRALRAGVDFYYRGDPARPADVLLRRTAGQVAGLTADEFPDPAAHLAGVDRVWLVVASTGPEDPLIHKPRAAPMLRTDFRRAALFTVHGATIAFYRRVPDPS